MQDSNFIFWLGFEIKQHHSFKRYISVAANISVMRCFRQLRYLTHISNLLFMLYKYSPKLLMKY